MKLALGLGASLGPRRRTLELALRKLGAHEDTRFLRASRWYRTPPMQGGTARNWFLNGVALFEVGTNPEALLARCRALEDRMGRRRGRFWADRPLDLDLLLADGIVCDTTDLTLPHPAIARRAFVLQPLLEIWPDVRDPRTGTLLRDLPPAPPPRPVPVGVAARPFPLYTHSHSSSDGDT